MVLLFFTIGYFTFHIYGLSFTNVPYTLVLKYFVFILTIILTYGLSAKVFGSDSQRLFDFDEHLNKRIGFIKSIFCFHLLLIVTYLLYPEFILQRLVVPKAPDLTYFLNENYEEFYNDYGIFNTIRDILKYLTFPFYLYYTFTFRTRPIIIFFLLLFPTYVSYTFGYVSRADILIPLVVYLFYLRKEYRKAFRRILFLLPVFLFFLVRFLKYYSYSRVGLSDDDVDLGYFIESFVNTEFGFIQTTTLRLIETGKTVDLLPYLTWLTTLPIPKSLFFSQEYFPQINFDISSIILGIPREASGWYVLLPGLLGESIYIYGTYFFFLHGVYLGIVLYLVFKSLSGFESLFFLKIYVFIFTLYNLNRAGVGSYLPFLVNSMLFFHLYVLLRIWLRRKKKVG